MRNFEIYSQKDIGLGKGKKIKEDGIQVWCVNWRTIESFVETRSLFLSPEEQKYISGYMRKEDRLRSAAARVLLRDILSDYGCEVLVKKDSYGKPYIKGLPELKISISHSGDLVMLALSFDKDLGVDAEQIKPIDDYETIAKHHFCPSEYKVISREKTIQSFYRYWTAKEAYVKALGVGMYREFDSFEVGFETGRIRDFLACRGTNIGKIAELDTDAEYAACLVYV